MKTLLFIFVLLFCVFGCTAVPLTAEKSETSASYPFNSRTLEFDNGVSGLVYPYRICSKRFLGICTGWTLVKDVYDLTDPVTRKMFVDGGWTCTVEVKP